ncbi:PR domain zinc finger protein 10 [Homalodisca vitripennis]|nr:PR domain zinc finger protein 10 [Homalodisca vitripennis]
MRRVHPVSKDNKAVKSIAHRYESWTCSHCKLTFNSASILNLHTLVHAANDIEGNISAPDDTFHKPQDVIPCPQCSQKFCNKRKLASHVAEHGKNRDATDKKFHCKECGRNFISAIRFQIHCERHEDDEKKPLQCHICLKRVLTKSALSCHLKIHDCSVQWECPMCKQQFSNVLALRSHVHSHAIDDGLYHCPHCEKEFEEYSGIRKHIRAFHSVPKYVCQDCGKRFPTQDKLRMHLLKHSDHREFLCADCGKQFKRKDKLKEHMKRLHSSDIVPDKLPDKKIMSKMVGVLTSPTRPCPSSSIVLSVLIPWSQC